MQHYASFIEDPTFEIMNEHLATWSAAGWELVTVTTTPISTNKPGSPLYVVPSYTLFWRKP